jgi:hypothetical protein
MEWLAEDFGPNLGGKQPPGNTPVNVQNFSYPRPLPGLHPARSEESKLLNLYQKSYPGLSCKRVGP